jgi:hypothetical protein
VKDPKLRRSIGDNRFRLSKASIAAVLIAATGLLAVPAAVAKDFGPGDLRVCGRTKCVPIMNRSVLRILSSYYWGPGRAPGAGPVRHGTPGFELRFRGGYPSGMVASVWLNRFRAYGFMCGRFERGKWYRFPARAVAEMRRLAAGLEPLQVSAPPRSC